MGFAESGAGKENCGENNPFGFGVPCWDFPDYTTAIRSVANTISSSPTYERYQETHDIADLAQIYNARDTVRWVETVTYYQEKLRRFE